MTATKAKPVQQMPDIENGSLKEKYKLILLLTWPALAENLLSSLVSMADTMMVSGLGSFAVSAVGLVTQPRFIMLAAFMALGTGTTALVARCKGAKDPEQANQVVRQSLIMSLALLVVLCIAMFIFMEPLIRFIAGSEISEETVVASFDYFRIQILGFPILGLTFIINAALRGAGNTRAAFYSNSVANIVNVIFNYCLIHGNLGFPAWGVLGASVATVIGQCVAFVMSLYWLMSGKQYIKLDLREKLRIDTHMMRRISNIGMPALLEQIVMRVGMLVFTMIVTALGDTSYAAHIIGMNIQQLSFTTGMAFGTAATTLTGQCLGRKREDLARLYVKLIQKLSLVVSIIVALGLFFFGGSVARLYSQEMEIILMVALVLKIIAVVNPLSNSRFVYNSALRGAGDSRFTAKITFVGILLVRPLVALALINLFHMGLTGVWIALVSDAIACYILANWRWRGGKWATLKV